MRQFPSLSQNFCRICAGRKAPSHSSGIRASSPLSAQKDMKVGKAVCICKRQQEACVLQSICTYLSVATFCQSFSLSLSSLRMCRYLYIPILFVRGVGDCRVENGQCYRSGRRGQV